MISKMISNVGPIRTSEYKTLSTAFLVASSMLEAAGAVKFADVSWDSAESCSSGSFPTACSGSCMVGRNRLERLILSELLRCFFPSRCWSLMGALTLGGLTWTRILRAIPFPKNATPVVACEMEPGIGIILHLSVMDDDESGRSNSD